VPLAADALRNAGAGRRRIVRFACVGSAGFAADALVLTALVNGLGWMHYSARAVSFAVAVTLTWYLNRRWVFTPTASRTKEYGRYVATQIVGAAINLGVYVAAIERFEQLARVPAAALAIGSAAALAFNYLASSRFVFRAARPEADRAY
jgi:putative flippase GtrA